MKFPFLWCGLALCGVAPLGQAAPAVAAAPAAKATDAALLPPAFTAGDLTLTPVEAGFDYGRRVFPGAPIFYRVPIFTCTFRVAGAAPDAVYGSTAARIVLRRMIGPQGQFVEPFDLNHTALQNREQSDIYGFYNAKVDPNWDFVDVDVDVLPAPEKPTSGKIKIDELTVPAPGGEVAINRQFVGDLGTKFDLIKMKRDDQGQMIMVVREERPAALPDLEIASFGFRYEGATPDSGRNGGGGLSDRFVNGGETEITLFGPEDLTTLKNFEFELFETAPSLQNRAAIKRQRLRFPLKELRAAQTIAPLAAGELPGKPSVVGRARNEQVAVAVEYDGINRGDWKNLMIWSQATPADTKRGLRWDIASGSARFAPGGQTADISTVYPPDISLWHSDGTTRQEGETTERRSVSAPSDAATYDLKLNMEGRLVLHDDFTREIIIPADNAPQTPVDDEEHSLILRTVQRFSSPTELGKEKNWANWPKAGVLLVFEKNPLLPGAEMEARAFDAEDNLGRALNRNIAIENTLFRGDLGRPYSDENFSKFYSLIVGAPAPDAKSLKVWLGVIEKAAQIEKTTLEIKAVPAKAPQ